MPKTTTPRTSQSPRHELPPDPDSANGVSARTIGVVLATYRALANGDADDLIPALLTDVMHWCDRNRVVFDNALDDARRYYVSETTLDTSSAREVK